MTFFGTLFLKETGEKNHMYVHKEEFSCGSVSSSFRLKSVFSDFCRKKTKTKKKINEALPSLNVN